MYKNGQIINDKKLSVEQPSSNQKGNVCNNDKVCFEREQSRDNNHRGSYDPVMIEILKLNANEVQVCLLYIETKLKETRLILNIKVRYSLNQFGNSC